MSATSVMYATIVDALEKPGQSAFKEHYCPGKIPVSDEYISFIAGQLDNRVLGTINSGYTVML